MLHRFQTPSSHIRAGLLILAIIVIGACSNGRSYRDSAVPLETEAYVDIDAYLGTWYEIARLPNPFEKGCDGVTADYARRDDGLIRVVNRCRKGSRDGPVKTATGRARIVDETSNARLKVSFFGPFWGDYWILDLDTNAGISLVGEPSGKYLWILARTPDLPPDMTVLALKKLKAFGYDTSALYFTQQPPA